MTHTLGELQRQLAADHGWQVPVVPGTFAARKMRRRAPRLTVEVRGWIEPQGADSTIRFFAISGRAEEIA